MNLTENKIKLVENAIKDYAFMSRMITNEIFELQRSNTVDEIFDKLENFIGKFKSTSISNVEKYKDEGYIDFCHNDVSMSISLLDNVIKVSKVFEIFDNSDCQYIVEDWLTVEEYAKIIKESKDSIELKKDMAKIKNEIVDEINTKINELYLDTLKKYEKDYNISYCLKEPIDIEFTLFEKVWRE